MDGEDDALDGGAYGYGEEPASYGAMEEVQEQGQVGQEMQDLRQEPDRAQQVQRRLKETLQEADRWRTAFKEVATLVGFTSGASREPDPQAVIESVQRMKAQGQTMQDEIKELHKREAALQISLADRNLEAAELRREITHGWAASEPALLQLRQLLLDPAVNREFVRMRAELDEAQKELKRVQEELAVAHFTPDSKVGRQLMAKCRSLADENEEMGNELAEGRVHQLETQLSLSKGFADELRLQVAELFDHCNALNEEMEGLQREVFGLRRKVKEFDHESGQDFHNRGPMMGGEMSGHMGGRGFRGRSRGPPFRGRGGGFPGFSGRGEGGYSGGRGFSEGGGRGEGGFGRGGGMMAQGGQTGPSQIGPRP